MDAKSRKELEKLIKFCRKLNVSELKTGDTHVIFGESTPASKKPSKAAVAQEKNANFETTRKEVNDEIDTAHIENPVEFENAIVDGLLKDEEVHTRRTQ